MPDRLTELKRQRALIAEHLLWLDREIGALESGKAGVPQPPPLVPPREAVTVAPTPSLPADAIPAEDDRPDPALTLLQEAERQRGQFSKSGCWIVFATLLLIGVGGITTYILVRYG